MRRRWLAIALLLWGLSVFAGAQKPDPARLLAEAVTLQQSGKTEEAVRAYERFLAIYPKHPGALSNLGAAYARLSRFEDSVREYTKALTLAPSNPDILFNLGLSYYKMGQVDEAVSRFEQVVKLQPSNAKAALLLSDCYLQSGKNQPVIDLLSPLEAVNANDLSLAYLLGTALIREGQTEKGEKLIDRILSRGESAEGRLMVGIAHLMGKDYPGALKEFERAVQLNPRLPSANSYYGKTLQEVGRPQEAVEAFRRELEVNPYDFDANLVLGVYNYEDKQDYEAALGCFERALRVRPKADEVRFQVALVYLTQGRVADAQILLEDIVRASPQFLEAHTSLANVYYRLRRKEDGDRHRAIVEKLRLERKEKIAVPAAETPGRGANTPSGQPRPGGPR